MGAELIDAFCVRWIVTLLHFLWQGIAIGITVAVLSRVFRGKPATWRYAFYTFAMLSFPLCVGATFALLESSERRVAVATTGTKAENSSEIRNALSESDDREHASESGAEAAQGGSVNRRGIREPPATGASSVSRFSEWPFRRSRTASFVAVLYFAGACCFLSRLVLAICGGNRLRASARVVNDPTLLELVRRQRRVVHLKFTPAVALCERVAVPTVVGVLRPMVLLPAQLVTGLDPEQFAMIIVHEFAHIRRWDLFVNLCQRVIESLLFFHPVVWLVSRRMSVERELCCDDLVVATGNDRMQYARALLEVAEACQTRRRPSLVTVAAAGRNNSQLERRILRLLRTDHLANPRLTPVGLLGFTLILMAAVLSPVLVYAWVQPSSPPRGNKPRVQANRGSNSKLPTSRTGSDGVEGGVQRTQTPGLNDGDRRPRTGFTNTPLEKIAEATAGEPELRLPDHLNVRDVRYTKFGESIVSVATEKTVTIRTWDARTGELKTEVALDTDKHGNLFLNGTLKFSGNGKVVVAIVGGEVGLWDTATGKSIPSGIPAKYKASKIAVSRDGKRLATAAAIGFGGFALNRDVEVVLWDSTSGKELRKFQHPAGLQIHDLAFSPDGTLLGSASQENGLFVWDVISGETLHHFLHGELNADAEHPKGPLSPIAKRQVLALAFHPESHILAATDMYGIKLWDIEQGKLRQSLTAPFRLGRSLIRFSRTGNHFARASADSEVIIWSTADGNPLHRFKTDSGCIAFSPRATHVAIGFSDREQALSVWRVR